MTDKVKVRVTTLGDYVPQMANANDHTQRGMGLLEASIERNGIGDGITVAADGESISGAARLEKLAEVMPDVKVVEVETDGRTLIVNKRVDLASADDPRAVELGIASNRVAQVNLQWNPAVLAMAPMEAIEPYWKVEELQALPGSASQTPFEPNMQPDMDARAVTDDDVRRVQGELDGKFGSDEYVAVTCPKCAEEFFLKKGDVK